MRCHICLSSPGLAASAAASTVDAGLECIFKSPKPEEAHSTEEEEEERRSGTRARTPFFVFVESDDNGCGNGVLAVTMSTLKYDTKY